MQTFIRLVIGAGLLAASAWAQSQPAAGAKPAVEPLIEQLRLEDKTVRIDERRVGGQTQHISVQPKNMPAYELGTHSSNRNPATDNLDSGATSAKGWRVFGF